MKTAEFINAITEAINVMDSSELVQLNNRYCEVANYLDNVIYDNESEFFSLFRDVEHFAQCVSDKYEYGHNYVTFDGYGNLESFNRMSVNELVDLPTTMAEYIAENWEDFSDLFTLDIEESEEESE